MGFYANGNGGITFKEVLPEEKYNEIKERLNETFYVDGARSFKNYRTKKEFSYFDIWNDYGDYYSGDAVESTLNDVAAAAPIEEGEIFYRGEDDSLWRFIFKDGAWVEENGEINYTGVDAEKLFSALQNYVFNDLEAADHAYVYDTLTGVCGLEDSDLVKLGLADLVAEQKAVL